MKTADLIPFILLELNESDKYGFELTKNIETKSKGQIVIKQPTLYTVLKKLEKSKFISSYWQDSDIGGKRHYYTLTANGKMQVSTLPSYEELLNNMGVDIDDALASFIVSNNNAKKSNEEPKTVSIMDAILNQPAQPIESIVPTEEIFSDDMLDSSTEIDLNLSNAEMLKDEQMNHNESFAANEDVATFTQRTNTDLSPEYISKVKKDSQSLDVFSFPNYEIKDTEQEIKFVDYIDFKKDKNIIKAKTTAKRMLVRTFSTSAYLILMLILSSIGINATSSSALYNTFLIGSICVALFYPLTFIWFYKQFETKCKEKPYKHNLKHNIILSGCLFLISFIVILVVNIAINKNTFSIIFAFSNFANFYAPLLISSSLFADILFAHLLLTKFNK